MIRAKTIVTSVPTTITQRNEIEYMTYKNPLQFQLVHGKKNPNKKRPAIGPLRAPEKVLII